jgi:hypothetical protein
MQTILYNDMQFSVEKRGDRWDITYQLASGGPSAIAGAGLFAGLAEGEAGARALALIKTIFPVGIKSVGPDVAHPNTIGDLKIVGPDVTHPNFIYWNKESVSCPKEL